MKTFKEWPSVGLLILIFHLGNSEVANAASYRSSGRISAAIGLAQADVLTSGLKVTEEPFGFTFVYEQILHHRLLVGVEHLRTLRNDEGTWSTAVALTQIKTKWFPLTPISPRLNKEDVISENYVEQINLSPFVGFSTGFSQSSLRDKTGQTTLRGTVGIHLALHLGCEMPLGNRSGVLLEGMYADQLLGTGKVKMFSILTGFYFYL